ncbi:MAG: YjbQ family protein [Phycisphaeraceae bacterium]|nr:YjbQ family protein [Phycisphaeraceae bacterium]
MSTFTIQTRQRSEMQSITGQIQAAVRQGGIRDGVVMVHVPHTTAGITINENADPDVVHDMLEQLDRMVPWRQPFYQHAEGNSAAHVKASMMGSSALVQVRGGQLVLGRWQGIFFCEFDGPRTRQVQVTFLAAASPS